MDRRLMGALLVVAVLTLAVIIPARDGVGVVGTATIIEFPADPRVGDCLLDTPPAATYGSRSLDRQAVSEPGGSPLAPTFGPCAGQPVNGEVVAIVTAAGDPGERLRQVQANGVNCRNAALQYSGLTQIGSRFVLSDQPPADPVTWMLSIKVRGAWLLPAPLLQTAGRTWAACVALPSSGEPYRGRLAGAFLGGRLPDEFGVCWDRRVVSASIAPVGCGQPHLAELLSVGTADTASVAVADVRASCLQLAARVMKRADPTAGGGLTVLVSPDVSELAPSAPMQDVLCYVAPADQSLTGTLVGLRDRPIPYSR